MPSETWVMLLALVGFGLLHSLTAASAFKRLARTVMGERAFLGLYRLLYNILSGITFLPVAILMMLNPGPAIWSAAGGVAALLIGAQVIALVGLSVAALQIDLWRFAGVRQAIVWLTGGVLPLPPEPLIQHGVYGLVRHPLYLFAMLYLWASPQMNAAALGFALGATVYFVVGAWLEECRMTREFGASYAAYQRKVPWMIPFVHVRTPRCTADEAPPVLQSSE